MVNTVESTSEDADAVAPEEAGPAPTPRWAWVVAGLLVLVPVAGMGQLVLAAHPLPYNDYWPMLDSVLDESGGFRPTGLFELRNEHPVVAAKLLFWLNLRATGGSNVAMGLVVMGVALGQLAVLAVLARDLRGRWRLAPPVLVTVAAFGLFGRQGAWHFVKSMSGAAWLTANLFALLAIWAQVRLRPALAIGFALLATLSYGTGLAVWPVLVLVGLLAGARALTLVPAVVVGTVATFWLQAQLADQGKTVGDRPRLVDWFSRTAEIIGSFLFPARRVTAIRVGEAVIAIGVVGTIFVIYRIVRRSGNGAPAAPWLGLVAFGAGMGFLVSGGRNSFLFEANASRYSAIGAITIVGVAGVILALTPRRGAHSQWSDVASVAVLGLLCLVVLRGGAREVDALDASYARQDLLGIALETKIFDRSTMWLGGLEQVDAPGIEARLAAAGHDSHVDDDLDCGLLGSRVAVSDLGRPLPTGVTGQASRVRVQGPSVPDGIVLDGWVDGGSIECVVVIAPDGEVVGAGGHGPISKGYGVVDAPTDQSGGDEREWFSALSPVHDDVTAYVRFDGDDRFYALPVRS